ncbi:SET domain-containing protein-lysine N-methyltransferase [Fluviispira multicolorata]|uniref:SET domain-containing protein-lysine N-methyltransferase n=1 Tax=Fluviispira multicolorata TaxID=2654512 RepID=A0A833N5L7_9BACT|nr:SET domain-containing protein [Fluviispira multicolorata]KAB8030892.1 SET domain-containing protein-lysine N-methyltransferase [Fluviispira multicolorata]
MHITQKSLHKKQDEILLHLGLDNFEVKESQIHGLGLYSKKYFAKNTELGPSLIHKSVELPYIRYLGSQYDPDLKWEYSQTTATRFINHNNKPNLKIYKQEPDIGIIYAKCLIDIFPGDELTLDYKETALIAEDFTDKNVVEYYCKILEMSLDELYSFLKLHNKAF